VIGVKTNWTDDMITYLIENYEIKTNKELAGALGLTLTVTRTKLYQLGLKRIVLEYWTPEQIQFLKDNYKNIGDVELAEIFEKKWKKNKKWTKCHIDKKRNYLNLKRTNEALRQIHKRNVAAGRFSQCAVKRGDVTGRAKEGEIRMWRQSDGKLAPRIKINGKFIHWNRWIWEKEVGPIPKGMNVIFKDNNPANYKAGISNLEIIDNAELSRRNSMKSSQGLSDNFVLFTLSYKDSLFREEIRNNAELIELKRQQLLLQRSIKNGVRKKAG